MDSLILGLRVLVSLAAVLGLMWFLHRRLRRAGGPARAKAMTLVARQGVGPKASVVLLETDGTRFLLGVTEHGISVLHTADAPVIDDTSVEQTTAVLPLPTLPRPMATGRRAARLAEGRAAVFGRALDTELHGELGRTRLGNSASQPLAGSILDLGTWRQAADALRAGRRR